MSRVQHWVNPTVFKTLTQAQMQAHWERGIGGYVLGGPQWPWSKTAPATLLGPLKPNIELAHAVGQEVMLGVTVTHRENCSTPLAPWFDDGGGPKWEGDYADGTEMRLSIKTMLQAQVQAMKDVGADEIWIDGEEYSGRRAQVEYNDAQREGSDQFLGQNGRWSWRWDYLADNYPSTIGFPHLSISANTHTEAETRAQVRMRGEQFISWILEVWPDVKIASDYNRFEGSEWDRQWQMSHPGEPNAYWERGVQKDFWGGILSNPGIGRFRHLERGFYRNRSAENMEANRVNLREVYLSLVPADHRKRLHNILRVNPMIWLDPANDDTHPYPGDANNLEHCINAGRKAEDKPAVYAHKAFSATQYNDDQIYRALTAAGEQTPATVPPYEEPEPPPPPADCSACEAALSECEALLAGREEYVAVLEASVTTRTAEVERLSKQLAAIRGALAALAAEVPPPGGN